jgi:TPR repeat protein
MWGVVRYERAARQGLAAAQFSFGFFCMKGKGVPKDEKAGIAWYEKAALAGHASAQNNLGIHFENGKGVERDEKKAVDWSVFASPPLHTRLRSKEFVM